MNPYRISDQIILRSPLFAMNDVPEDVDPIVFFENPICAEALFVSSPDLYYALKEISSTPADSEKNEKIKTSLRKYIARMKSRATPFGLMASVAVLDNISIGPENAIIVEGIEKGLKRRTRLDMLYLGDLLSSFTSKEEFRNILLFYPNSSLYDYNRKLRYIEDFYRNGSHVHRLSHVDMSDLLVQLIEFSKKGKTVSELIKYLVEQEVQQNQAANFVNQIIDNQILISELGSRVTGEDLLNEAINIIALKKAESSEVTDFLNKLKSVQDGLLKLDHNVINKVSAYEKLEHDIALFGIPYQKNRLFQVELFRTAKGVFPMQYQKEVIKGFEALNKLTPVRNNVNLENFGKKLVERYESQLIPLTVALDLENGIGYNSLHSPVEVPLVDRLPFPSLQKSQNMPWTELSHFLVRKATQAMMEGKMKVVLTASDLKDYESNWEDQPASFSAIVKVFSEDGKTKLFSEVAFGSTAARLVARFSNENSPVNKLLEEISNLEDNFYTDQVVAEITHLPENRAGNIIFRSNFRKFEIPYLARPSVLHEFQISINDLYVTFRNGRIILYSKRLNKEVIPKISNAHNYGHKNLPIYQFLCDLAGQGLRTPLSIDWGFLRYASAFLPRLEYEGIILSLARWNLSANELLELCEKDSDLMTRIHAWRMRKKLPDQVTMVEQDNLLLINFKNPGSVQMLISSVRKGTTFQLQEFPFEPEGGFVTNSNGNTYANEFILSFLRNQPYQNLRMPEKHSLLENSCRVLSIGSDWLYFKIYCGPLTMEKILLESIAPLMIRLYQQGVIAKWFFVRYRDPEFHLRLRLQLKSKDALQSTVHEIHQVLLSYEKNRTVWRIQADTYNREIERYKPYSIDVTEDLFHAESVSTALALPKLKNYKTRMLFCIKSIDRLMDLFNLSTQHKELLTSRLDEGIGATFGRTKSVTLKKKMSEIHRENRVFVDQVLKSSNTSLDKDLLATIEMRNNYLKEHGFSNIDINEKFKYLASVIHMTCNRIFHHKQREQEMVVYFLMSNAYRTRGILESKAATP